MAELHLHPVREIVRAGGQRACRRPVVTERLALVEHRLFAHAAHAATGARMRPCAIGVGEAGGLFGHRTRHAGGLEDALAHEDFPRLASDFLDELARDGVQHVVVRVAAAEAGRGLDVAQGTHGVGAAARRGRDEHQVARPQPQAAAVDEQVAHRHLVGDPRVVHAEPRHVVDDLVVPVQLAVVDEHGKRGGGDRLAGRTGGEDRVGVHALGRTEAAHAVALGQRTLAVLDDRDRHARHAMCPHRGVDARIQVRGRRGECGTRQQRRCQQREARREAASGHVHSPCKEWSCAATTGCGERRNSRHTPIVSSGRT